MVANKNEIASFIYTMYSHTVEAKRMMHLTNSNEDLKNVLPVVDNFINSLNELLVNEFEGTNPKFLHLIKSRENERTEIEIIQPFWGGNQAVVNDQYIISIANGKDGWFVDDVITVNCEELESATLYFAYSNFKKREDIENAIFDAINDSDFKECIEADMKTVMLS